MTDYHDFTAPTIPARFQRLPPDCEEIQPQPEARACSIILIAVILGLAAASGFVAGRLL